MKASSGDEQAMFERETTMNGYLFTEGHDLLVATQSILNKSILNVRLHKEFLHGDN